VTRQLSGDEGFAQALVGIAAQATLGEETLKPATS